MTPCVDGAYPGQDIVPRLHECRTIGKRERDPDEELAVELAFFADIFPSFPEVELRGAEDIAGVGKDRAALFGQAADVIGMTVGDHHDVAILGARAVVVYSSDGVG